MKIHVLMSGPIRPSLGYVIDNVKRIKELFGDVVTHLAYWDTRSEDDARQLREAFDHVYVLEEPTAQEIFEKVSARTQQQTEMKTLEHWTIGMYKMFYGLRCLVERCDIESRDIVIRMRTDLWIDSVKNAQGLLNTVKEKSYLFCPRESGWRSCDWFSISTYNTFAKVWFYPTDSEYNEFLQKTRCAETMITDKLRLHKLHKVDINPLVKLGICRKYTDGDPQVDYR
jgi:hypothetical protein